MIVLKSSIKTTIMNTIVIITTVERKRVKDQIINYKSLPLCAYELSVDYEPSLNTTIRQNTKML